MARAMIVVTTQCFPPNVGGIEAYVAGLADALARHGHSPNVFCDAAEENAAREFDSARAYPIKRFRGPRGWRRWRKARAVVKVIRQNGARVVVADSWKSLEILTPDALKLARVVSLAHGAELLAAPGTGKAARIVRAFQKATLVAANSQFTADLARKFVDNAAKVRVVLPGVDAPPGAPRSLPSPPCPRGQKLLTIARLEPQKGVDTVLQSLSALQESYPDMIYDVVGSGSDTNRLAALADGLGVGGRVRFHGRVSDIEKARLLSQADVFVLANRRDAGEVEGFGIVLAEAAAFGIPAIAGSAGGTGDAVIAGKTGLIVDGTSSAAVQAALTTLFDDSEVARRMGIEGHKRFWSEFAWDAAIKRFEATLFDPIA